ncbi:MAG: hypothetical protein RL189_986 [Pseudomonadota bacterium]
MAAANRCFAAGSSAEKNVECLNTWTKNDALKSASLGLNAGEDPGVPLTHYSISVCGPQYFDSRPQWLPAQADVLGVWTELTTARQFELFTKQIRSAVDFLKAVHKSMRGIPNGWFKDVVICPRKMLGDLGRPPLQLLSGTLFIWMREQQGGYQVIREDELLRLWNNMEFESDVREAAKSLNSLFNNRAFKIWTIVNPIGTLRTRARAANFDKRNAFVRKLKAAASISDTNAHVSAVKNILVSMARESADPQFAVSLDRQLISGSKARCIAGWLFRELTATPTWQSEQDCTSQVISRQIKNSVQVRDVGIYVGNLHSISVSVGACHPEHEKHLIREKDLLTQSVVIERVGVAVHTVDDVRVAVNGFVFPTLVSDALSRLNSCP